MGSDSSPPAGPSPKVLIGVGVVCLVAVGLAVAAAVGSGDDAASTTTSVASTASLPESATSTTTGAAPIDVPLATAGESISGETPCPAEDGSSPRVTSFENPPPTCIDTSIEYRATIRTDEGDLTLLLDPDRAPESVNNFVVLSRYHYYDGQAMNGALPRSHVQFGGAIEAAGPAGTPGYRIPGEPVETIYTLGTIGFVPDADGTSGAEFFLTTYDEAANLPVLTTFGILLDGAETMASLDRLATESGRPSGVATITSIDIEPLDLDG